MFFYDLGKSRIFASVLLACTLLSARWIPFRPNVPEREPQIVVLSSDMSSVMLNIETFGFDVRDVDTKQTTDNGTESFSLLTIDEYAHMGDVGKPKLPIITSVLDVPHGAEISVELISAEYKDVNLIEWGIDKRIMPALASVSKSSVTKAEFVIDEDLYALDAFYPQRIVTIEEHDGYARGHRLATVQVSPICYNPATGTIRCYTEIQLSINFIGGDILHTQRTIEEHYSPVWEDFIEKMVVNYPTHLKNVLPLPIYYDIFYNGQAQTVANKLAEWKTKKGFKVRMWNAAGWSSAAIDDTIEAQNPQATFLVVIGDPNSSIGLPSGSATAYSGQTDLYYAETDGTGYLPDLFHARISVADTIQGNTAVEKAIRYEQADFGAAGTAWLKKACLIAGYDSYYQPVGMATNWYCRNLLVANGYSVDTLVYAYGEQEGRVITQINDGHAWMVYTAHGGQTEWWVGYSSDLTVSELTNLTNNLDMYCFPAGHCCLTGDFDYSQQCFGETWDRLSGKGGLSYFGSVPSTYWDEDDWLQRRYFDAIYTDSIPGRLYETGRFTQWGLYWIENNTNTFRKKYYFEAYHIFNDPSLDFWTNIPQSMAVTHNAVVFPGNSSYTVTVTGGGSPIENALICLWIPNQSPEMHLSEYTDASGSTTFSIAPTTPGDTMYVTVTAHDYIPYQNHALVIVPSGPYITAGSYVLDDGNNNQANPGDTVGLGLWAKNIGVETAYSVYGLLTEDDVYVTMDTDSSWYGNIASSDSALSAPYYSFAIGNDCPDGHSIDFTVDFTDTDDNTWTSNFVVTVYAPILVYQGYAVLDGNGVLEPGETVNLAVTLENEGGATAEDVTTTLTTDDVYLTILTDTASYGSILPDSAVLCLTPYVVQADSSTPTPHMAQVVMSIVGASYASVDTFQVLIGNTGFYDTVEDTVVTNQYTVEGQWHRTQRKSYSPSYSWWNGNEGTGQYSNNVNASIITPLITLGPNSEFACWNWYNLETGWDYGYIEISTDGGSSWSQLESFNGVSSAWEYYSTALSYPVGTQVKIRFRLDTDSYITREGWYVDEIRVFDQSGVSEVSSLVATEVTRFFGVYPNPFKHHSEIGYQLARAARVSLCVYDVSGRLVRSLSDEVKDPGYYTVSWDSRDDQGRRVPAGVYFVRFHTDDHQQVQKTVLLK